MHLSCTQLSEHNGSKPSRCNADSLVLVCCWDAHWLLYIKNKKLAFNWEDTKALPTETNYSSNKCVYQLISIIVWLLDFLVCYATMCNCSTVCNSSISVFCDSYSFMSILKYLVARHCSTVLLCKGAVHPQKYIYSSSSYSELALKGIRTVCGSEHFSS